MLIIRIEPPGERMLFKFFGNSKVDEFAKSLAQDIAKRYPPAIANNPEQMISQKRLTTILEDVFNRAHQFNSEHKLGMFKKAKLGNTFKWELKEMGYDEKFTETATEGLIVYLTRGPS
jgi:rRNA maturation protein Rpf1